MPTTADQTASSNPAKFPIVGTRSQGEIPANKYTDLIGQTPLIDLSDMVNSNVEGIRLYGKAEFMNPGFSMKDRIVKHVLETSLKRGILKPAGTVVVASSGNTGASVAMLCATMGLKAVVITSPKCSQEKMSAITAYGATLLVEKDYMKKVASNFTEMLLAVLFFHGFIVLLFLLFL